MDNVIGAVNLSSLSLQGKRVILAIGPERGWSERERGIFLSSGFSPVLLGSRILRTETAAVCIPEDSASGTWPVQGRACHGHASDSCGSGTRRPTPEYGPSPGA